MLVDCLGKIIKNMPGVRWGRRKLVNLRKPQGSKGIQKLGHREYVGGKWDTMGKLQFDYLISQGLHPHHYLIDIACGSLRAGVYLIPYLETGHYLGIEKEEDLVQLGIEKELGSQLYEIKKPRFVISSDFNFERFDVRPDYAIAQSLFTHLPISKIEICFKKLRSFIRDDGVLYATFHETEFEISNLLNSHDHDNFASTKHQMEQFGEKNGWKDEYIGDWGHPRGQVIVRYRPV